VTIVFIVILLLKIVIEAHAQLSITVIAATAVIEIGKV